MAVVPATVVTVPTSQGWSADPFFEVLRALFGAGPPSFAPRLPYRFSPCIYRLFPQSLDGNPHSAMQVRESTEERMESYSVVVGVRCCTMSFAFRFRQGSRSRPKVDGFHQAMAACHFSAVSLPVVSIGCLLL
jgi:hypothetical protein